MFKQLQASVKSGQIFLFHFFKISVNAKPCISQFPEELLCVLYLGL